MVKFIPTILILIGVVSFISAVFQLAENASNDAHAKCSVYNEYSNCGEK